MSHFGDNLPLSKVLNENMLVLIGGSLLRFSLAT